VSRIIMLGLLATTGCGLNMQKNYAQFRPNLVSHNYDAAEGYLESVKESF
jgi:hypothetical protein